MNEVPPPNRRKLREDEREIISQFNFTNNELMRYRLSGDLPERVLEEMETIRRVHMAQLSNPSIIGRFKDVRSTEVVAREEDPETLLSRIKEVPDAIKNCSGDMECFVRVKEDSHALFDQLFFIEGDNLHDQTKEAKRRFHVVLDYFSDWFFREGEQLGSMEKLVFLEVFSDVQHIVELNIHMTLIEGSEIISRIVAGEMEEGNYSLVANLLETTDHKAYLAKLTFEELMHYPFDTRPDRSDEGFHIDVERVVKELLPSILNYYNNMIEVGRSINFFESEIKYMKEALEAVDEASEVMEKFRDTSHLSDSTNKFLDFVSEQLDKVDYGYPMHEVSAIILDTIGTFAELAVKLGHRFEATDKLIEILVVFYTKKALPFRAGRRSGIKRSVLSVTSPLGIDFYEAVERSALERRERELAER